MLDYAPLFCRCRKMKKLVKVYGDGVSAAKFSQHVNRVPYRGCHVRKRMRSNRGLVSAISLKFLDFVFANPKCTPKAGLAH